MNRANCSAKTPKRVRGRAPARSRRRRASGRRSSRGVSRRTVGRSSTARLRRAVAHAAADLAVAPALGQQVVEQVVDGDRAEQAAVARRRPARPPGCRWPGSVATSSRVASGAQGVDAGVERRRDQGRRAARAAAAGCARRRGACRSASPAAAGRRRPARPATGSAPRCGRAPAPRRRSRPAARITGSGVIMPPAVSSP